MRQVWINNNDFELNELYIVIEESIVHEEQFCSQLKIMIFIVQFVKLNGDISKFPVSIYLGLI